MSVSLSTAKAHLRVSSSSEDTLITAYLNAAIAWVERYTKARLGNGTVTDYFTAFGDYLQLSTGPYNTVTLTSINYVDADGGDAEVTIADAYLVDGKIYPPAAGWPTPLDHAPINVVYTVGFATAPTELDQAVLLLVGHFYQYRDESAPIPQAVEALCGPFRLPTVR